MATKTKQKTTAKKSEILNELQKLNEGVDDLYDLIERGQKKALKPRVGRGIANGLLQAVGLVVGTLVMTAILVYVGQAIIRSDAFQNWLEENLRSTVTEIIFEERQG